MFGHFRLLLHVAHSLGYTVTTGSHELSVSSNNRPQTKITISRASKPLGIAPSTGRNEPLLQISTNKGETSVVEDSPGTENYRRTALLPKINLAMRYKSTVTALPPSALRAYKSAMSLLEVFYITNTQMQIYLVLLSPFSHKWYMSETK